MMQRFKAVLIWGVLGCSADGRREGDPGGVVSGATYPGSSTTVDASDGSSGYEKTSSTAEATGGSQPAPGTAEAGGDGESIFDVGGGESAGLPQPNGDECQKIDFLFVVDNSASMFDEQQALISSFPGFISTIEADVNARDYRVMVIDTDTENNPICTGLCEVFPSCAGQPCAVFPPQTACDGTLGSGLVNDADGLPCGLPPGQRFVEAEAGTDFSDQFACLARVGIAGQDGEQPMGALVAAMGPEGPAPACNGDFLRSDAILVVTVLTDEEDDAESPGDPQSWHQAVVAAKAGNPQAVVVLGLIGDTGNPGSPCGPLGAENASRLQAFVDSFPYGLRASICEPQYDGFLQQAVDQVDEACKNFGPEG